MLNIWIIIFNTIITIYRRAFWIATPIFIRLCPLPIWSNSFRYTLWCVSNCGFSCPFPCTLWQRLQYCRTKCNVPIAIFPWVDAASTACEVAGEVGAFGAFAFVGAFDVSVFDDFFLIWILCSLSNPTLEKKRSSLPTFVSSLVSPSSNTSFLAADGAFTCLSHPPSKKLRFVSVHLLKHPRSFFQYGPQLALLVVALDNIRYV